MRITDPAIAREVLGLSARYSADALGSAFRAAAMRTHPDRGGDPADFNAVVEAHDLLRRALTPGDPARRTPSQGAAPDPNASVFTCHRRVISVGLCEFVVEVPGDFVRYSNVRVDCGTFDGSELVIMVRCGTPLPWTLEPSLGVLITVRDGYDGIVTPGSISQSRREIAE